MPRMLRYDSVETIPPHLEAQIRSLLRAEWPSPDGDDAAQPLTDPELHPVYFILADRDRVVSYARTIWAAVSHLGQNFKLYGLGDVVTEPGSRHKGYGGRILQETTSRVKSDREADAALLLTEPKLEAFYRRSGWAYVPGLRVAASEYGECAGATFPMMLFLSAEARAARKAFPRDALVLPGDEW